MAQSGEGTGTAGEGALIFRKPIWNSRVSVQKERCLTCGNKTLFVPTQPLWFCAPALIFWEENQRQPRSRRSPTPAPLMI